MARKKVTPEEEQEQIQATEELGQEIAEQGSGIETKEVPAEEETTPADVEQMAADAEAPLPDLEIPEYGEVSFLSEHIAEESPGLSSPADDSVMMEEVSGSGPDPDGEEVPEKTDRQIFFGLNFREMDRYLTPEEKKEWNSIYAAYRGRTALSGTIIGVDSLSIGVRNPDTGEMERKNMYCAVVIPYRVRIMIPETEMWIEGQERPDYVMRSMVGATIDFHIIKVDREGGFAIGSRALALKVRRRYFAGKPTLNKVGAWLKCRVIAVGPRRCLVECHGHDISLTQRELRYASIPDLRDEYHPGMELDCILKKYNSRTHKMEISIKETESNPFDNAEIRHPEGCRRQAVISGKYAGGVFCNLPDGTVCMCSYSYQYTDADFMIGDTVILVVERHNLEKKQMYGKILSKW